MSGNAGEQRPRNRYKNWLAWVLIGCGAACGVAAIFLAAAPRLQERTTPVRTVADEPTPISDTPKPNDIVNYIVAPDAPKFIAVPAIDIKQARVKSLGVRKNNQIAAPDNIHDAGWYMASAKPGQKGAMFMYGHVSNWEAKGLLYDLKKLKKGDVITITRGDNQTFTYSVVASEVYAADKVPMERVLAPIDAALPGLNVMTCSGLLIKGTDDFSERLVVYTTLVR